MLKNVPEPGKRRFLMITIIFMGMVVNPAGPEVY
jgi:hypothetical protein